MEAPTTGRERRRRRVEAQINQKTMEASSKRMENVEHSPKPDKLTSVQSSTEERRRDTFISAKESCDFDVRSGDDVEDLTVCSVDGSKNESSESRNLTFKINSEGSSNNNTYNVPKPEGESGQHRPVPAPRRCTSTIKESEKVSSDTDRDVTEIDLDDVKEGSDTDTKLSSPNIRTIGTSVSDNSRDGLVVMPVPKPRKRTSILKKSELSPNKRKFPLTKSKSAENLKTLELKERTVKSDSNDNIKFDTKEEESKADNKELPLIKGLHNENMSSKSEETKTERKSRKLRLHLSDVVIMKSKKEKSSKKLSIMSIGRKLEKRRNSKGTSDKKEQTEKKIKETKVEEEDDKSDFQIDSPRFPASVQNGHIYVQNKYGFYLMDRKDVLKNENGRTNGSEIAENMEDSTVTTAILFQKYWSRSMTFFHGVLAGFGFSHAATVTAIMLHYNYEPKGFIGVYSCLSLKIHYIFYTLTTFCIISCFDRIDVGHINCKHWQSAWKIPSMWIIFCIYVISFGLTLTNQKTEARFDYYLHGNETENQIWETQVKNEIQVSLLTWYHKVWVRDILVLLAWLMISLTKFSDFLYKHLNNMLKYAETQHERRF